MALDFVTFGETMLRLSPPGVSRLEQVRSLDAAIGGSESNLAIALARLGKRSAWVSRLPANPLGALIENTIRQYGVDTGGVRWALGERLGLYFIEFGSAPRPTQVYYDRAGSAFSRMKPDELPTALIETSRWFHCSGITFGLSGSCIETTHAALAFARERGLTISFDVNYRARLWTPEAAGRALEPICRQADVILVALRDAQALFNAGPDARSAARSLFDRWGKTVALTCGAEGAVGCDANGLVEAPAFPVTIVDRIGAGDAFAAGVLCRISEGASLAEALQYGTAVAALKLTVAGDLALVTRAEVDELLRNRAGMLNR